MALEVKSSCLGMINEGGGNFPLNVGKLLPNEISNLAQVLESTGYYGLGWQSVSYELDKYTLPTAVTMTGKRDAYLQVKLKNANGQVMFVAFEVPVTKGNLTDVETFVKSFEGKTLGAFGAVESATFELKNVK